VVHQHIVHRQKRHAENKIFLFRLSDIPQAARPERFIDYGVYTMRVVFLRGAEDFVVDYGGSETIAQRHRDVAGWSIIDIIPQLRDVWIVGTVRYCCPSVKERLEARLYTTSCAGPADARRPTPERAGQAVCRSRGRSTGKRHSHERLQPGGKIVLSSSIKP